MTDTKKADQQASLKKAPHGDNSSRAQRLITLPEVAYPCVANLDGIAPPFGTKPEKE